MMDGTTADITGLTVPEDDGSIAKAITQLDAKLSAWSSAMRDAQRQLKDRLEQASSADTTVLEKRGAVSDGEASESVASLPEKPVSVLPAEVAADDVEPICVAEPPEEPETDVAAVEPQEENSTPPFSEEDEEAFLANLEPDVAMKIRVMRRLSTTRKSARELLKEIEGRTTGDREERPKKLSWFTGGR